MTTNDEMIARLPKERQDKINQAVAKEVAKYKKNESTPSLNETIATDKTEQNP